MTDPTLLGIDVGGTSIKARLVGADGAVLGRWREPTPRDDVTGSATLAVIERLVATAGAVAGVDAVGVVVPGIVDETTGTVRHAVNLGWRDLPLRDLLTGVIAVPLGFGQDVRAGAIAESVSGAAAGVAGSVIFVPIGTGIASALVVDGVPHSQGSWPGEFGQDVLTSGPHAGSRVEEITSAGAIARRAGAANAHDVAELVRSGDPRALTVWSEAVDVLANALVAMLPADSPTTFVIGGGLAEAGGLLLDPLGAAVTSRLRSAGCVASAPHIVPAAHGDAAAEIGATILAGRALTESL